MTPLEAIKGQRKTGSELFHANGAPHTMNLLSFWQWACSDLSGNVLRGVLAEYLVARDLGCATGLRQQWDSFDLLTDTGIKVEVKSAAYLQSWHQAKPSAIQFGIAPTLGWDPRTNEFSPDRRRQADVYVFALLSHKDKGTLDPLNTDQWDFYILPAVTLDMKAGSSQTISLSSLLRLDPLHHKFGTIGQGIVEAMRS